MERVYSYNRGTSMGGYHYNQEFVGQTGRHVIAYLGAMVYTYVCFVQQQVFVLTLIAEKTAQLKMQT